MSIHHEQQQIADWLARSGLDPVAPTLLRAPNRPDAHVWQGWLYTQGGDAQLELLVYSLSEEPALIADYEEELSALKADARRPSGTVARVLVLHGRTPDYGVIVTTPVAEAEIVHRFLHRGEAEESTLRTNLTYHPQVDRLFGGDFVREVSGRWVRASLLSLERAQRLYPAMLDLDSAYTATYPASHSGPGRPYPVPLTVLQLTAYDVQSGDTTRSVSIPELFAIGSLAAAPVRYHELAQMHTLVPGIVTLQDRPLSAREAHPFARQLFRIIGSGHRRVGAAFSRAAGGSLRPEFITPAGELIDLYFLTRAADELSPAQLRQHQYTDLLNAFLVLWDAVSAAGARFEPALIEAVTAHLGPGRMAPDLLRRTAQTAQEMQVGGSASAAAAETLGVLADAILETLQ